MGPRLQAIKAGVEREGWRFVAFVRLVPVFPFNLLNYALGLTRLSVRTFAVTSWLTMAPGALAYAYLGAAGREAVSGGPALVRTGLLALTLLVAVALLPALIRRWRHPGAADSAPTAHAKDESDDESRAGTAAPGRPPL
jgi:uncharacterized membrane protein YdjX (TVP38/TMEM64 family)